MVPSGNSPRRRHGWSGTRSPLTLAARVLVGQGLIGAAFYGCAVASRAAGFGVGALAATGLLFWVLVVAWTRRFGTWQPRCWLNAVKEGSLLFIGAVCWTNIFWTALEILR